jgi:hypothetical protein
VTAPRDTFAVFRALRPADVVQYPEPTGNTENIGLLPPSPEWPRFDASGPHDVERTIPVPLRAKLGAPGGALAYGVTALLGPERNFLAAGLVQLTDLGVFAQWFPDGGSVRVHRIADGTPVAGAQVDVYPSQAGSPAKTTPVACASGMTNASGVAAFGGAEFARCSTAADKSLSDAPSFVTIVRRGGDWTYLRTDAYSGAYSGDFFNGWSAGTPIARGTIFSDR